MKDWLKFQRARFTCLMKDHELGAFVKWSPEIVHLDIVCDRCGKHLGHMHLPAAHPKISKEKLH